MDKLSYALGLGIGQQLVQMGVGETISIDDFAAAIKDVVAGNELKVSHRDAQVIVQEFFQKQDQKMRAERAEKGKAAKADGEKFLTDNAKKEGVITLPSGLQYKVLKEGNGRKPKATDQVKCHYEGFLIDGTVFDSSVQRGELASPPCSVCSRSLPVGPRVCSSCRKVPSIASSSLTCWDMVKVVPAQPFLRLPHSSSM